MQAGVCDGAEQAVLGWGSWLGSTSLSPAVLLLLSLAILGPGMTENSMFNEWALVGTAVCGGRPAGALGAHSRSWESELDGLQSPSIPPP